MSENDPKTPTPPAPAPPAPAQPAQPPPPPEDAGSEALSDALRSSFFIVKIIMVGLVIVFLGSGFFTVGPQEKAIVLRMGRPVGQGTEALLGSGFHFAWPRPIDEIVRIPFSAIQRVDSTVGWDQTVEERMKGAEAPPAFQSLDPRSTSYALTSDTNIVLVNATIFFSITDPIRFHFDFSDSLSFVTNDLNNALLFACSQFPVDDVLSARRGEFHDAVERRVRQLVDEQQLGVNIVQVNFGSAPARYLKAKFEGVDKANVDREKARDQALSVADAKKHQAAADAEANINKAESERARVVASLAAEATNFTRFRGDYDRNPEMFKTILLMPALERVLHSAKDITAEPHRAGRQIRLLISGEAPAPPKETNSVP